MIRFASEEDLILSWSRAPRKCNGFRFFLFRRTFDFHMKRDTPSSALWLSFPELPLPFQNPAILYMLGNFVSQFFCFDSRIKYVCHPIVPHICVEAVVSQPMVELVWIAVGEEFRWKQAVVFESWIDYCSSCRHLGHLETTCHRACRDHHGVPLNAGCKRPVERRYIAQSGQDVGNQNSSDAIRSLLPFPKARGSLGQSQLIASLSDKVMDVQQEQQGGNPLVAVVFRRMYQYIWVPKPSSSAPLVTEGMEGGQVADGVSMTPMTASYADSVSLIPGPIGTEVSQDPKRIAIEPGAAREPSPRRASPVLKLANRFESIDVRQGQEVDDAQLYHPIEEQGDFSEVSSDSQSGHFSGDSKDDLQGEDLLKQRRRKGRKDYSFLPHPMETRSINRMKGEVMKINPKVSGSPVREESAIYKVVSLKKTLDDSQSANMELLMHSGE